MKRIDWKRLTRRRTLGLAVMALGLVVLFMPVFVGGWIIALLGIALLAAGLFQFVEIIRSGDKATTRLAYAAGIVTTLLGLVLFLSPNLALSGLLIAVTIFLLVDGGVKIYGAFKQTGAERWWSLFNGFFSAALGLLIWYFVTAHLGITAIGIILGLRLLVEGWSMFFLPEKGFEPPDFKPDPRLHPERAIPSKKYRSRFCSFFRSPTARISSGVSRCSGFSFSYTFCAPMRGGLLSA
jgi:uncharacterized membrane protein HdeD (DUF308 family)